MIRILVVDDHVVVRSGLRTLLGHVADCEICGEASNGQEGVERALQLKPDLVLMDISMPILNGLEATKVLKRDAPSTKIIVLTMHDSAQIEQEARRSGAHAYLTKACPVEELRRTIAEVCKEQAARVGQVTTSNRVDWSCPGCGVSGNLLASGGGKFVTEAIKAAHDLASPTCAYSEVPRWSVAN